MPFLCPTLKCVTLTGLLLVATAVFAQDQRTFNEPAFPAVCQQLTADLSIVNGVPSSEVTASFDTTRIQNALNTCSGSGKAVQLSGTGGNFAFLTKPLTLPSNVILLIDAGVTLFASRNPADYQHGTPSSTQYTCDQIGPLGSNPNGCNPLFSSYNTTGAGVMGYGVINGRGGEALIDGTGTPLTNPYPIKCTVYSWYCIISQSYIPATNTETGVENNPMLFNPIQASNFTWYKISIIQSPYFNMRWQGPATGLTVWGAKLITPAVPANTDGIDPVDSISNVTITNTYISNGDDNIAITANSPTSPVKNISITNVYTYAGDGMSIGTGLSGGVSNVVYTNIYQNAEAAAPAGGQTGIKIKSASDRGGLVNNISYNNFCMQNEPYAINIGAFVGGTGTEYPWYTNLGFHNINVLANASGVTNRLELQGYDASHITTLNFDNVIFANAPTVSPVAQNVAITYGPGPVSSALKTITGTNVTDTGSVTNSNAPYACSTASFPALIGEFFLSTPTTTNQKSLTATYPLNFTLNAVIEPPMAESPALTQSIVFYDGATAIGTVALGLNGANHTFAPLTITSAIPGTHTYTAQYPQDSNYATFPFGSITVTIPSPVAVSATPISLTLAPGTTGTSVFTFTPNAGYTGSVTITCASPVSYITCSIASPPAFTGTTPTQSTATITVAATYARVEPPHSSTLFAFLLPFGALLFAIHKRRITTPLIAILLATVAAGLIGCGGSSTPTSGSGATPPPAGTQTLTFTTTANGTVTTTSITVNVT